MKLVSALFVVFALSTVACGGAPQVPQTATPEVPKAAASDVKAPGEAKVGDKTTCPVSKEEFTVTASSPKVEHEGKTYYFCCSGCDAKFKADPKKFVGTKS